MVARMSMPSRDFRGAVVLDHMVLENGGIGDIFLKGYLDSQFLRAGVWTKINYVIL